MIEHNKTRNNICQFIKQFRRKNGNSSDFFPAEEIDPKMELHLETYPRYIFSNDNTSTVHEFILDNVMALTWIDKWCVENKSTALLLWQESADKPMEKIAFYFEGTKKSSSPMGNLEKPEGLASKYYSSVLVKNDEPAENN
jgi:hypothetical protein